MFTTKWILISIMIMLLYSHSQCVKPTKQIDLYPNTQDSPSLYLIGFQVSNEMEIGSYILFNFGQLSDPADPYNCILVNTSINIRCTNFDTPSFSLTFAQSVMEAHNSKLIGALQKCLIIQLQDTLSANTQYFLQVALRNTVQNKKQFSESCEIYCLTQDGLVIEQNLNFGSILFQPPVLPQLSVSILNDLSQNTPGTLSTLKAQIQIDIPISTTYSALIFILQHPFTFSESSYLRIDESQDYATNPIPLNSAPDVAFFEVKSANIFYVAFNEKFETGRKFIIDVTEIKNPFFLASSNISIYSSNFNSLTPLEQFQQLYPIATVTQQLSLNLGLPYDMPIQGPCIFYKNLDQFFRVQFNMPMSVPQGFSIKLYFDRGTIRFGSAYINFQSVQYTTKYTYTTSTIIMKQMGPISQGSLIYLTFKAYKDSVTNFYVTIDIDTEEIIQQGSVSYMFQGRDDNVAEYSNSFIYQFRDTKLWETYRPIAFIQDQVAANYYDSYYIRIRIYNNGEPTSAGSYVDMYLSPLVEFDPSYNENTDCYFHGTSSNSASCIATVNKTSQFVHITVKAAQSYLDTYPNPFDWNRYFYIKKIRFPTVSTAKNLYQSYFRLFNSSAVGAQTYIQPVLITTLAPVKSSSDIVFQQIGNTQNLDYRYPGFLRFACTDPGLLNYREEQNQIRVITLVSQQGFRGMGTIDNQGRYPCTSNIDVECYYQIGQDNHHQNQNTWDRINIFFPGKQQNQTNFHVIVPHTHVRDNSHYYNYYAGVYNKLTKDYKYYFRSSRIGRTSGWVNTPQTLKADMVVDFEGKAGSYRDNVSVKVSTNGISNGLNFLVITSAWYLFQNGKTLYSSTYTNPTMGYDQMAPLSVLMGDGMYITVIPFSCSGCSSSFQFHLDQLHMPYHYDLPNYYMFVYNPSGYMSSYNEFQMTNGGIFYEAYLKSLTLSCLDNYLGIKNTICQVKFNTNSPLKADSNLTIVFSGMNIATDNCQFFLSDGTLVQSACYSTEDNKNVTIKIEDTNQVYHHPSNNFTIKIRGVSIQADKISQSMTLYVHDKTGKYVIQKGTRIFTTTVSRPENIQVSQIIYNYLSPLASNKMSLTFTLPRGLYDDQRFGFIMGQDLSDVNLQIKRLKIVLTRLSDGLILQNTNQLISSQYKILFTFKDRTQLISGNYSLQIFGIMTPASHQNGAFSIIYQRKYDKGFTLTNSIETIFPVFNDRIISNISMEAFFNTQGNQQMLQFDIVNQQKSVNDDMVWIINFPSYYSQKLFNHQPYCMIDSAPIQCFSDPTTPYQMIIKNSPKIILPNTLYTIAIYRLACPRSIYAHDTYRSRYIFFGILEKQTSQQYIETTLLYPQQDIAQDMGKPLVIEDITVTTITNPTFSSIYAIFYFQCQADIDPNTHFYMIFPEQFDNFNNKPMAVILKQVSPSTILTSVDADVAGRVLTFQITAAIAKNTKFSLQFPSLPTPRVQCSVQMSQTSVFITQNDKKKVVSASSLNSNSAPILQFIEDPRYISFNHDNTIIITAGTYSKMIDITSSDDEEFLTNVNIQLSADGFTFEPSQVFLRLGDEKGQFRVGADLGLLPISYFYNTVKTQQVFTYYTITKNNNIRVTNNPVEITIPSSITIPQGGCSKPFTLDINNAPVQDLLITYNYDNYVYDEKMFRINQQTTKAQLQFLPNVTEKIVSFCTYQAISSKISSGQIANNFVMTLILSGTNHASYKFNPSTIDINIVPASSLPSPSLRIQTINQQKSFLQFNLTINNDAILYYHFQINSGQKPIPSNEIKIKAKNNINTLQEMSDFMSRMYTTDRLQRVGVLVKNSGQHTIVFEDLLPQRYYTLCVYMQTQYNIITSSKCVSTKTQKWGDISKASVKFSQTLSAQNLNRILCFFTKQIDTQAFYVVDLQGNSCDNRKVSNLYFNYPGQTFSNQKQETHIYIFPNPYISSDPSVIAFQNMYDSAYLLNGDSLSSAISGFAIDYLSSKFIEIFDGIAMLELSQADRIQQSFDKPEFNGKDKAIVINNIKLNTQASIYFALILYKQILTDGNNSYVNIRLNTEPSKEQIINCQNWQNLAAEGCARAVYSDSTVSVRFNNIKQNCMYILYYVIASEYPLRPNLASQIKNDTVVTIENFQNLITNSIWLFLIVSLIMLVK